MAKRAPPADLPSLLSSADVEGIFGRSARTLVRWEAKGVLLPVRIGGAKFYHPEDVRRLIAGRLENAIRPAAPRERCQSAQRKP